MAHYPVNPGVLQSARKVRNLTLEDAADLIGIDAPTLEALEKGEEQPTITQLRKIANKYQFPLATLGHPDPLPPRKPITDFRTVRGDPATLSLPVSVAVDEARQIQEFAAELMEEDAKLYHPPKLPTVTTKDDPAALAAKGRGELGFTSRVQLESRDAADTFNFLRTKIEDLGVFVYLVKVPVEDCRGFCLVEEGLPPVVAVNDAEPLAEAETFTLLHEYCHVLLGAPGISTFEFRNPTERFCNLFAANFLMPRDVLAQILTLRDRPVEWDQQTIVDAARRLRVSQQALVLRLEELGQAPMGFYDRWMAEREDLIPPKVQPGGFAPWERRVLRKFGTGYAGMVLDALGRGTITMLDAYRLLKVKPPHLEGLRRELASRHERVGGTGV